MSRKAHILRIQLSEWSQMEHTQMEKQDITSTQESSSLYAFPVTAPTASSRGTTAVTSNIID